MDRHTREHLHETPAVVWVPLVLLAIPSVIIGAMFAESMLFGDHFGESIVVASGHETLLPLAGHFHGALSFALHGFVTVPFWLAMAGVGVAWYLYLVRPDLPGVIRERLAPLYNVLERKYGFDEFNEWFFAAGARGVGKSLWRAGDVALIDGLIVNGSARFVGWVATVIRHIQTGYLYTYAFGMIIGLTALIFAFVTL